jgi:RsiW-degrading membrane proteinase PrsW (M82 family)
MKLQLQVASGSLQGCKYDLTSGALLLGRSAECQVYFDPHADLGVSGRHAKIESQPDGFYIVDQQSTNGTLVNGQLVLHAKLNNGDIVQLGHQGPQLIIVIENSLPPPPLRAVSPPPLPVNPVTPLRSSDYAGNYVGDRSPRLLNHPLSPVAVADNATAHLRQSFSSIGIYNPERATAASISSLSANTAIGLSVVLGLVVILLMVASVGVEGAMAGAFLAFLPAPLYLTLFLWLDRYDPEPPAALASAFAWGAIFAVVVSFIVNTIFTGLAATIVGGPTGDLLGAVISAPLVEEGTKGLGVLLLMLFLRREFDGVLDGIVYAGVIALGFATVENVLYYGRQFNESGGLGLGLLLTLFMRGVLSPFSHSLFTSMTGIGCGIARESHQKWVKYLAPVGGYLLAVILHGLWNLIASIAGGIVGYLVIYLVVWVPLFAAMIAVMIYMAQRETRIIREMLVAEVHRGLISPAQLDLITSSARWRWLANSLFTGQWERFQRQRQFLRAAAKLAFCYWHVGRATEAQQSTISLPQIPKFRQEVMQLQQLLL